MTQRVLFFCGDRSAYGSAHLKPLAASSFDLVGIVVPTSACWRRFERKAAGNAAGIKRPKKLISAWYGRLKGFIWQRFYSKKAMGLLAAGPNVKRFVSGLHLPILRIEDVNAPEAIERIRRMGADLHLSAAYPQVFSRALLAVPARGSVNFHPAPLPKYRGAHPHFWGVRSGEVRWAVSAHFMTERVDAGDLIAQRYFSIRGYDYNQLYLKMLEETPPLVEVVADFFSAGGRRAVPQNELEATYFSHEQETHKQIHWFDQSAEHIVNLIRTRQAFCFFRNRKTKLVQAKVVPGVSLDAAMKIEPSYAGVIAGITREGVRVNAGAGCICLRGFWERGREISASQWVARHRARVGERFV